MRLTFMGGAVGAFALMFGGQSAMAESNNVVQRTDPRANSPAGVIYQIPLDSARREAAPVLPVGSRPGDGGGGGSGTTRVGSNTCGSSGSAGASGSASGAGAAGTQSASAASPDDGGTPPHPSAIPSGNCFWASTTGAG